LTAKFSSPGLAGGGVLPDGSWGEDKKMRGPDHLGREAGQTDLYHKKFFLNIFILSRLEWYTICLVVPFIDIKRWCMKRHIRRARRKRMTHRD
jgi:hypothetical protein